MSGNTFGSTYSDHMAEPAVAPVAYRSLLASGSYAYSNTADFFANAEPLFTSPPPPAEWDVRKIMLEVVPGADGMGYEVYAKNVSEVVNKLTEMGQRIEDLEGASPQPPAEPAKPPGMAVQALAGEIVAALLADEKDGGYDLTAGMFGPAFSALVRRWAAAEWNAPVKPVAQVFGWVKSSEVDQSNRFGGSINLWRKKYDCDIPVYTAPADAIAQFNEAIDFAIKQGIEGSIFLHAWRHGDTSEWPEWNAK